MHKHGSAMHFLQGSPDDRPTKWIANPETAVLRSACLPAAAWRLDHLVVGGDTTHTCCSYLSVCASVGSLIAERVISSSAATDRIDPIQSAPPTALLVTMSMSRVDYDDATQQRSGGHEMDGQGADDRDRDARTTRRRTHSRHALLPGLCSSATAAPRRAAAAISTETGESAAGERVHESAAITTECCDVHALGDSRWPLRPVPPVQRSAPGAAAAAQSSRRLRSCRTHANAAMGAGAPHSALRRSPRRFTPCGRCAFVRPATAPLSLPSTPADCR